MKSHFQRRSFALILCALALAFTAEAKGWKHSEFSQSNIWNYVEKAKEKSSKYNNYKYKVINYYLNSFYHWKPYCSPREEVNSIIIGELPKVGDALRSPISNESKNWTSKLIGKVKTDAYLTYDEINEQYEITNSGEGFTKKEDSLLYNYLVASGNFEISTKVNFKNSSSHKGYVGVMIRQDDSKTSHSYTVGIEAKKSKNTTKSYLRSGKKNKVKSHKLKKHKKEEFDWIKLKKVNNTITSYISQNGDAWEKVEEIEITFDNEFLIGLVSFSNDKKKEVSFTLTVPDINFGKTKEPISQEDIDDIENLDSADFSDEVVVNETLESLNTVSDKQLNGEQVIEVVENLERLVKESGETLSNEQWEATTTIVENLIITNEVNEDSVPLNSSEISNTANILSVYTESEAFNPIEDSENVLNIIDKIMTQKVDLTFGEAFNAETSSSIHSVVENLSKTVSSENLETGEEVQYSSEHLDFIVKKVSTDSQSDINIGGGNLGFELTLPKNSSLPTNFIVAAFDLKTNPFKSEDDTLDLEDGSNFLNIKLRDENGYEIPVSQLEEPIAITIKVDESKLDEGFIPSPVYYNEVSNSWETDGLSDGVLNSDNTISFTTNHLTVFTVSEAKKTGWRVQNIRFKTKNQLNNRNSNAFIYPNGSIGYKYIGFYDSYRSGVLINLKNIKYENAIIKSAYLKYNMNSWFIRDSKYKIKSIETAGSFLSYEGGEVLGESSVLTLDTRERKEDIEELLIDRITSDKDFLGLRFEQVSGQGGFGYNTYVTLNVTYNNLPTSSNQTLSTNEDIELEFNTDKFKFIDLDSKNVLSKIKIENTPSSGNIYWDDELIEAGSEFSAETLSDNTIKFVPHKNFNGTTSLSYKVHDGLHYSASVNTITFNVKAINDAPVASSQDIELEEDDSTEVTLTASDIDSETLTYSIVSDPKNGTLSGTAPNLIYTPDPNFNGDDNFTFKVNDGDKDSETVSINLTIEAINDPPTARSIEEIVHEDKPELITLPASDVDGDNLTFNITKHPSFGKLSGTAPNLTYTPNPNYDKTDSFQYSVSDGDKEVTGTISILIKPYNDSPVADPIEDLELQEDSHIDFTFTGSDIEGDPLNFFIEFHPKNGKLSGTAPNITYTPNPNFNGDDSFIFYADDKNDQSERVTVKLTVTPVNDAPIINPIESITINEDQTKIINLSATDVDNVDSSIDYSLMIKPFNGTVTIEEDKLTYVPNNNYYGHDLITIRAYDGIEHSNPMDISVTINSINDKPIANSNNFNLQEDEAKSITLTASDIEGNNLTYSIVSQPSNGTLTGSEFNRTYTPNPNFNGNDSFTFKVNDGQDDSETATINLTVVPVNDAPTVNTTIANQSGKELYDFSYSLPDNIFTDVENDDITLSVTLENDGALPTWLSFNSDSNILSGTPALGDHGNYKIKVTGSDDDLSASTTFNLTIATNEPPKVIKALGSLTLQEDSSTHTINLNEHFEDSDSKGLSYTSSTNRDGNLVKFNINGNKLELTPVKDAFGSLDIEITLKSGDGRSVSDTLSVTIENVNDAPTIKETLQAQQSRQGRNFSYTFSKTAFSDIDGDTLTYSLSLANGDAVPTWLTINNTTLSGFIPYDALNSYDISVTADDNNGGQVSQSFTLTIQIDQPPVITQPFTEIEITENDPDFSLDLNTYFNDPDNTDRNYSIVTNASTVSAFATPNINGSTLTISLNKDKWGEGIIVIKLETENKEVQSTLPLKVNRANVPPTLFPVNDEVNEDTILTISLPLTDINGDTLVYTTTSSPTLGSLTIQNNQINYTPNSDINGIEQFGIIAYDGIFDSNQVLVNITINPVNDTPSVNTKILGSLANDIGEVAFDPSAWIKSESTGPTNESAQQLSYSLVNYSPENFFKESPSITSFGLIRINPKVGADGISTLTIRAQDDGGTSNGGIDYVDIQLNIHFFPNGKDFLITLAKERGAKQYLIIDFNEDGKDDIIYINNENTLKALIQD